MDFARQRHFSTNLEEAYQNGDIKKLTVSYRSSQWDFEESIDYEIDLAPEQSILKIYLQHCVPLHLFLIASEMSFDIETEYADKTMVKEMVLTAEDAMQFIYCLFKMYDVRLLGDEALKRHPAVPLMFDGHRLDISINLEWTSGEIDSVTFEEYSVADCILKTAGAFSKSLKSLLIYEVW